MELRCARCGRKLLEKHYLIQTMVYLGRSSPRRDLCKSCYEEFIDFMDEDMEDRNIQLSDLVNCS